MKVLVVDDNSIVLDSCRRVLEAEGFEVRLASSVNKALEAMNDDGFDLLLIDVKMPERNGMDLMGEVKQTWPDIPVIVMSGYPTTETICDAARMGAANFIPKPFTPDELIDALRQVIPNEESHETDESPGH